MTADVDIFFDISIFLVLPFFFSSCSYIIQSYFGLFKKKGFFLHSLTICQLPVLSRSELGGAGGGLRMSNSLPSPLSLHCLQYVLLDSATSHFLEHFTSSRINRGWGGGVSQPVI